MDLVKEDLARQLLHNRKSTVKNSIKSKALSNYVKSQKDVESLPSSKMLSVLSKDLLNRLEIELNQEDNLASQSMLRSNDNRELTHIVALTSYTNEKTINDCKRVGIKKVINKPLSYKTLHKVMWKHYFRVDLEEYKPYYKIAFNKTY